MEVVEYVWKEGKKEEKKQVGETERTRKRHHTQHKRMKIFLKSDPGGWTKTRFFQQQDGTLNEYIATICR